MKTFERTGEFRVPLPGEWYEPERGGREARQQPAPEALRQALNAVYQKEELNRAWIVRERVAATIATPWLPPVPEREVDGLLAKFPAPRDAFVHGIGTDIEFDLPALWALVMGTTPRVIVELGTRQAVSTRTLAHAAQQIGSVLFTVDPADCSADLEGVPAVTFAASGEEVYDSALVPLVDLLFVDTDPHSYWQTQRWLDTWVQHRVISGGVAIFHDILGANLDGTPRPDIRVLEACRDWVGQRPGWRWEEHRPEGAVAGGLGILWRPALLVEAS